MSKHNFLKSFFFFYKILILLKCTILYRFTEKQNESFLKIKDFMPCPKIQPSVWDLKKNMCSAHKSPMWKRGGKKGLVIRMERLEYDNQSVTLNQTKLTVRIFGLHNFPGNVSTLCSWVLLKKYLYKYSIIRTKMRYSIKFCPSYIPWPPIFKRNVFRISIAFAPSWVTWPWSSHSCPSLVFFQLPLPHTLQLSH